MQSLCWTTHSKEFGCQDKRPQLKLKVNQPTVLRVTENLPYLKNCTTLLPISFKPVKLKVCSKLLQT